VLLLLADLAVVAHQILIKELPLLEHLGRGTQAVMARRQHKTTPGAAVALAE
jgi:hypothetical protein